NTPAPDELLPDYEGLGESFGTRLYRIGKRDAPLTPIAQQPLIVGQVDRCGDDENVRYACEHQRAERVVDHRFVVDGQQLLAYPEGHRMQARPRPSREHDSLQTHSAPTV